MAKITRKTQKIFGSTAGTNQIAQFGSLAAGAPAYTTDPAVIQSLTNYLAGWFAGVIGSNSPAIEDMNALCYLFTYQLGYLCQTGVAEWDSATTYYIGSLVNDNSGNLFLSLTDTNLNNALTSTANWRRLAGPNFVAIDPSVSSPYTIVTADNGKTFNVNSANAAMQFTLPAAAANFTFTVKDVGGLASLNNITVVRAASEQIEGFAATYTCQADYGSWTYYCDGTNWWLT